LKARDLPPSPSFTAILETARTCAARGNVRAARDAYRRAVRASGSDADILIEFAVFEATNNRSESARNLLVKALGRRPGDPAIILNLGEVARLAGDHAAAADHYGEALALVPNDHDAAFGLGEALIHLRRFEEAVPVLERAAALAPRDPDIRVALGDACRVLGAHARAADAYAQAVRIAPHLRHAWIGLARCLLASDRNREAANAFGQAYGRGALSPALLCLWARALLVSGQHIRALERAEQAIAGDPCFAEAYQLCGACLQHMGRFDEAEASLRRAIDLAPGIVDAYEGLAAMGRERPQDADAVERLLDSNADLTADARASAYFALYRIHDRADDRDKAFEALCRANDAKASLEPFDAGRHAAAVEAMIAAFDARFFGRLEPIAWRPAIVPIFILGMPRSGTTLAEQILAHFGEIHPGGERIPFRTVLADALDAPADVAGRDNGWAERSARSIASALAEGAADARFVTDKTPGNYMALPFIAWMFPDARIIRCVRDPRDVGFSCFEQNFRAGVSFAYRLDAFACAHRCYEQIWAHWRSCSDVAVFDLRYEHLVREPEAVARSLVEYCGLAWDPACLDTARPKHAVRTASFWQVRQPINSRSVGKWRRYEPWLKEFLKQVGPVGDG
jgi:tetratricopeptide (TPR) repeat protein